MPVSELEQHPYLSYYKEFKDQVVNGHYKGVIIGSFPIHAITDTINESQTIIEERFGTEASMRFFYGSRKSNLWKYVGLALVNADPRKDTDDLFLNPDVAVENCKKLIFSHRLLISDSLYRTNRKEQSSDDTALMVKFNVGFVNDLKSVNTDLKNMLRDNREIKNIYFTSTSIGANSPYGWFKQIFGNQIKVDNVFTVGVRTWSAIAAINFDEGGSRNFNLFFLPTPKTRGIHWNETRTLMFENFLKALHKEFYEEINLIPVNQHTTTQSNRLSELRSIFLIECYRQAIVFNNVGFNGGNSIM